MDITTKIQSKAEAFFKMQQGDFSESAVRYLAALAIKGQIPKGISIDEQVIQKFNENVYSVGLIDNNGFADKKTQEGLQEVFSEKNNFMDSQGMLNSRQIFDSVKVEIAGKSAVLKTKSTFSGSEKQREGNVKNWAANHTEQSQPEKNARINKITAQRDKKDINNWISSGNRK